MTKLVVIVGFLISFAAGVVVGLGRRPVMVASSSAPGSFSPATRPGGHPDGPGGWLTTELNLTPTQQEEMHKIWSEVARRGGGHEQDDRRRQFRRDRDDAIVALIRPEDKPRYEQLVNQYNEQMQNMDRESRASFEKAVELTRQLLTPEQRTKYDELLSRHQWNRGPRGQRGGGPPGSGGPGDPGGDWSRDRQSNRRSDAGATSRPATQP